MTSRITPGTLSCLLVPSDRALSIASFICGLSLPWTPQGAIPHHNRCCRVGLYWPEGVEVMLAYNIQGGQVGAVSMHNVGLHKWVRGMVIDMGLWCGETQLCACANGIISVNELCI